MEEQYNRQDSGNIFEGAKIRRVGRFVENPRIPQNQKTPREIKKVPGHKYLKDFIETPEGQEWMDEYRADTQYYSEHPEELKPETMKDKMDKIFDKIKNTSSVKRIEQVRDEVLPKITKIKEAMEWLEGIKGELEERGEISLDPKSESEKIELEEWKGLEKHVQKEIGEMVVSIGKSVVHGAADITKQAIGATIIDTNKLVTKTVRTIKNIPKKTKKIYKSAKTKSSEKIKNSIEKAKATKKSVDENFKKGKNYVSGKVEVVKEYGVKTTEYVSKKVQMIDKYIDEKAEALGENIEEMTDKAGDYIEKKGKQAKEFTKQKAAEAAIYASKKINEAGEYFKDKKQDIKEGLQLANEKYERRKNDTLIAVLKGGEKIAKALLDKISPSLEKQVEKKKQLEQQQSKPEETRDEL